MSKRERHAFVLLFAATLSTSAAAEGMADMAKKLAPHESLITNGFFVLMALFAGLVIWEFVDQKRASRSSLDIAKLAAAAAKKQSAAGAPSGNLSRLNTPPTTRPFAPPPPPPPSKAAPPPPPPPSERAPSPFAGSGAESEGGSEMFPPAGQPAGGGGDDASVESTVAFSPNDAGSSGGWADLLQRVRAGEPEAASFQEASPPPSTEDESFAMPSLESAPPSMEAPPSAGSSSEAWEALLKRTTSGDSPEQQQQAAAADSSKISLNADFQMPGQGGPPPPPPPAPPAPPAFDFPNADAPLPADNFTQALDSEPATAPLGFGGGSSPFSMPVGNEESGAAPPPFSFPGAGAPPADGGSTFQLPGPGLSDAASAAPPTFKLPGAGAASDNQTQSFQLPTGGGGGDAGANPFGFMGGGAPEPGPPSQTTPLNDLFGGAGAGAGAADPGAAPSFQLPTGGGFDIDATNRTISLDFAQGGGQAPPPPFPKTEG